MLRLFLEPSWLGVSDLKVSQDPNLGDISGTKGTTHVPPESKEHQRHEKTEVEPSPEFGASD